MYSVYRVHSVYRGYSVYRVYSVCSVHRVCSVYMMYRAYRVSQKAGLVSLRVVEVFLVTQEIPSVLLVRESLCCNNILYNI